MAQFGGALPGMYVYYWIPGDNDDPDHPNSFEVPIQGGGPKLRDIRARFPLPGTYHFRFKMKWESGYVWMDVTNEDSIVPTCEDKVFAKVLRVNWTGTAPQSQTPSGGSAAVSGSPPPTAAAATAPKAAAPRPQQQAPATDLLFGDSIGVPSSSPSASPVSTGGLSASPTSSPGRKTDDFDMLFS
eukprot:TRINITY_DN40327_c0_g1_i1.p1 TRINITY_DN40327_c0_g1~~TRINITY_DN40327_c0_g1_i1.p1  ORF type:complete len:185 (-),score=44.15 TRINITY_DN40327_c0_g1_i1:88-642(-)